MPERAHPLVARQFVDLGSDDRRRCCSVQPLPRRTVALEPWMPGIHQQQRRGAIAGEESLGQRLEIDVVLRLPLGTRRTISKATCVSVPWEIHQVERRRTAPRHPVHIRQPGLTWRCTRARHPLPGQRVDEARLANIRSAHHRDLGQAVARKIVWPSGADDEFGGDLQKVRRVGSVGTVGSV